ncbi:MAG: hypothetical protein ABEI99_00320 [Halobaculum sp.]
MVAGRFAIKAWNRLHETDASEHAERIVTETVDETVSEIAAVFYTRADGGHSIDEFEELIRPVVRDLVEPAAYEDRDAVRELYSRAWRRLAQLAAITFVMALTYLIYAQSAVSVTPWPPDLYDVPLYSLVAGIAYTAYTGVDAFVTASRIERGLRDEAE